MKDGPSHKTHGSKAKAHLRGETRASIHDEGPELMAAGNRRDVEAIVIAFLHVLVHTRIGHIVVVTLLHGPVRIVHSYPLCCRQPQPDLLLRHLHNEEQETLRDCTEVHGNPFSLTC